MYIFWIRGIRPRNKKSAPAGETPAAQEAAIIAFWPGRRHRSRFDSSIWVLKRNGEILKFTQGSPDFFSLSGLDKPVRDPKSFYVSDTTDDLYLLDSGNNRLLVMDKKGVYKAQYQSDKFGSLSDLVVDEKRKKAYLLDGSKIYVMELK